MAKPKQGAMKGMFDDSKCFTAYATIEAGYWMLQKIHEGLPTRAGIVKAIDEVTGYDKVIDADLAKKIIPVLKSIIKAKKLIEADCSKDEEVLLRSQKAILDAHRTKSQTMENKKNKR